MRICQRCKEETHCIYLTKDELLEICDICYDKDERPKEIKAVADYFKEKKHK